MPLETSRSASLPSSTGPMLIRSACLTGYADLIQTIDLDPVRLVRAVGLDPVCLVDPDIKIPAAAAVTLLEDPAITARIPDLGLRLSEGRRLSNLGPLALAIRDAATVREAIEIATHYMPLHMDGLSLSMETVGNVTILKTDLMIDSPLLGRQSTELTVAVTHRSIRQISGVGWRAPQVWFSHSAPKNLRTHLRVFGSWVEFGRDCNGLVLDTEALDAPLESADSAMAAHVKRYLEPLLTQPNLSIVEKTKHLIRVLLISRRASVDRVAAGLGLSRRTLHRQLAQNATTFSFVLNHVRVELARQHVIDRGLSLTDIAHRLGFSNLSGFSRWFRREFDCSPLAWRSESVRQSSMTETASG